MLELPLKILALPDPSGSLKTVFVSGQGSSLQGKDIDFLTELIQHASPMQKRFSTPLSLKEVLNKALAKWNLTPVLRRYEVMDHWTEIVGEKISGKSHPTKFFGEILVVEVDHPAWVQELNLLKSQILEKMKKICPHSGIKNIRFMLK